MRDTWATAELILNYASKWMSSNTRCDDALCVQCSRWTCWINIYFSTNKTNGATQTEHTMHARTQHTRTHKIRTNNQTSLEEKQQKKTIRNFPLSRSTRFIMRYLQINKLLMFWFEQFRVFFFSFAPFYVFLLNLSTLKKISSVAFLFTLLLFFHSIGVLKWRSASHDLKPRSS